MAASGEKNLMEATAKHVISVRRLKVNFAGSAFVQDDDGDYNLLVGDSANSKLLLFESDFFYRQDFSLDSAPRDLAVIGKTIFIVTSDNKIRKCKIEEDDLITLDSFEAPKKTSYIDAYDGGLIVSYAEGFQTVGLDGTPGKDLKVKASGRVTVSPGLKRFYHRFGYDIVSGRKLSDGDEVFSFFDKKLDSPVDFAIDREGNVYACGFSSRNIVQISKNGRKHRVLVDKLDKVGNPQSLLLHPTKDQLVVFGQSLDFEVYDF